MMERRYHPAERHRHLRYGAPILRDAYFISDAAPPSCGAPPWDCFRGLQTGVLPGRSALLLSGTIWTRFRNRFEAAEWLRPILELPPPGARPRPSPDRRLPDPRE